MSGSRNKWDLAASSFSRMPGKSERKKIRSGRYSDAHPAAPSASSHASRSPDFCRSSAARKPAPPSSSSTTTTSFHAKSRSLLLLITVPHPYREAIGWGFGFHDLSQYFSNFPP